MRMMAMFNSTALSPSLLLPTSSLLKIMVGAGTCLLKIMVLVGAGTCLPTSSLPATMTASFDGEGKRASMVLVGAATYLPTILASSDPSSWASYPPCWSSSDIHDNESQTYCLPQTYPSLFSQKFFQTTCLPRGQLETDTGWDPD